MMRYLFVATLGLISVAPLLRVQQGIYEDHIYRAGALRTTAPSMLTMRGLSSRLIWEEAQADASPRTGRLMNLGLWAIVVMLTGVLARQLGLPVWIAAGVLVVNPLMIETLALLTGHAELIATSGVLLACVAVSCNGRFSWVRWSAIAAGLGLGMMG